ncbi:MAG TPA: 30S ribosomal protein S16 [Planctomycetota bacterium]|nr:30S ribosomal protein S16 [Planctomycetota bacterium]
MAVRIRFKMVGRKNRPSFRLVACDARAPRDGRTLELLGHYDPLVADEQKRLTLNEERVRFWLGRGARPTESAREFLRGRGILLPAPAREKKRRSARKRGRSRSRRPGAKASPAAPSAKR